MLPPKAVEKRTLQIRDPKDPQTLLTESAYHEALFDILEDTYTNKDLEKCENLDLGLVLIGDTITAKVFSVIFVVVEQATTWLKCPFQGEDLIRHQGDITEAFMYFCTKHQGDNFPNKRLLRFVHDAYYRDPQLTT